MKDVAFRGSMDVLNTSINLTGDFYMFVAILTCKLQERWCRAL